MGVMAITTITMGVVGMIYGVFRAGMVVRIAVVAVAFLEVMMAVGHQVEVVVVVVAVAAEIANMQ